MWGIWCIIHCGSSTGFHTYTHGRAVQWTLQHCQQGKKKKKSQGSVLLINNYNNRKNILVEHHRDIASGKMCVCRRHKSAESLQSDILKTYYRHARDTLKGFWGHRSRLPTASPELFPITWWIMCFSYNPGLQWKWRECVSVWVWFKIRSFVSAALRQQHSLKISLRGHFFFPQNNVELNQCVWKKVLFWKANVLIKLKV